MQFVRFQSPTGPRWGRLQESVITELTGAPYAGGQETNQTHPASGVKLVAPVEPSKIVCIGRNYAEHAAELGNQVPTEPMFFLKPPSALIGPGDAIFVPYPEHQTHWEGELAAVVGKTARNVSADEALDYLFGWTVANDVSDRDFQKGDAPFGFGRGKAFDTFCPCGPVLTTDKMNPLDTHVEVTCNGEVRQSDSTALMIHPVAKLVSHLSHIMTLVPGDLILTGTPKGVGPMKPGDIVAVTIKGIGTLTNPVR